MLLLGGGQRRRTILLASTGSGTGAIEVVVERAVKDSLVNIVTLEQSFLLAGVFVNRRFPFSAIFLHLDLVVKLGVVLLTLPCQILVQREMFGIHGRAVVLILPTLADILPAALLLAEIKASGIGKEDVCDKCTEETEPGDDEELLLGSGVGTNNCDYQGADLA